MCGVDLREKGEKQNSSYNGVSCARGMDFKHDRSRKQTEEEEEDPVEKMIMKTGCIEQHYKVQECMADNGDWRKCQEEVGKFRKCMSDFHLRQRESKKLTT